VDCFACKKLGVKCDQRRPYCEQCVKNGKECSGYLTTLTWGVGVASRGKLRGMSLPIAKSPIATQEPKAQVRNNSTVSVSTTTTINNQNSQRVLNSRRTIDFGADPPGTPTAPMFPVSQEFRHFRPTGSIAIPTPSTPRRLKKLEKRVESVQKSHGFALALTGQRTTAHDSPLVSSEEQAHYGTSVTAKSPCQAPTQNIDDRRTLQQSPTASSCNLLILKYTSPFDPGYSLLHGPDWDMSSSTVS
jgi:hypothetical protein